MGNKYVQCVHKALVKCKLKMADGNEEEYTFYPFVLNKYTGTPDHTGYSTIDEVIVKRLQTESKLFKAFETQGLLKVMDSLPASAQTAVDALADRDKEIYRLNEENAKLKEQIAKGGIKPEDLDKAVEAEREKGKAQVEAEMAKAFAVQKELSSAQSKITALTEELDQLKKLLEDKGIETPSDKPAKF